MDQFWPPAFPTGRGITVAVGLSWGSKAFLRAQDDGKYELWLGTAQVPTGNVVDFLEDLANSCRLPPDPANAVKLLNIHWDDKKLTRSQFEQMHSAFMTALSEYFSTVRERSAYFLAKKIAGGGVDAGGYVVICNNSWENLRIDETDLPINGQPTSMIKWVHQFQREVEQAFHGKFVRGKGWTPQ
jgi:hypothetical protein